MKGIRDRKILIYHRSKSFVKDEKRKYLLFKLKKQIDTIYIKVSKLEKALN